MKQDSLPPESNEPLQQTQRILAWSAYQEALKVVDREVLQQFQATISSLRMSLWIKVGTYVLQLVIVSAVLFFGITQVLQSSTEKYLGWLISLVGLFLLAILVFRNPVQSIQHFLVDLARVQIIMQGCNRQLNQIDAVFKQAFLDKKVDMRTVEKYLAQVQKVVDGNLESLLQFMEEMRL